MSEYNEGVCEERHKNIDSRFESTNILLEKLSAQIEKANNRFVLYLLLLCASLFTAMGALVLQIIKIKY